MHSLSKNRNYVEKIIETYILWWWYGFHYNKIKVKIRKKRKIKYLKN